MQKKRGSRLHWARTVSRDLLVRGVVGEVPRLVYGNDAGLLVNVRAKRQAESQLARLAPENAEKLSALREFGLLPLGMPYGKELLERVYQGYQSAINDPSLSVPIGLAVQDGQRAILRPAKNIAGVTELLTPSIREILSAYYNGGFSVDHVRAWRNAALPESQAKRDVYSNLWHNDEAPLDTLKLFVYLTDGVSRETGAFRCHTIPSTRRIMRSGYVRRGFIIGPARRAVDDPSRITYVEGGIGTTFIANPQLCLHRAGVPREGTHRDIIQFTFSRASAPLPDRWMDTLPEDDLDQ